MVLLCESVNVGLACYTSTGKEGQKRKGVVRKQETLASRGVVDEEQILTVMSAVALWMALPRLMAPSWMVCHDVGLDFGRVRSKGVQTGVWRRLPWLARACRRCWGNR